MRRLVGIALGLALASAAFAAGALPLNQATPAQLEQLGLSKSQAAQIVRYRAENGDFLQVEELLAVPQISRAVFNTVRDKVTVDE